MRDAVTAVIISLSICTPVLACAFNATSTSFYLRQSLQSISGGSAEWSESTSTTFKLLGAGGQTAVGTSTSGSSFSIRSGIAGNLYADTQPVYTLAHYHWRNDDGSETTATGVTVGEDLAHSALIEETTTRLRIAVSNEGGTETSYAAQQFRLEYAEKSGSCAASSGWTDIGANGGHFDMSDSSNLTEGAHTTNIVVTTGGVSDPNHTFMSVNGGVRDTTSQTGSLSISSDAFVELEFSLKALAAATDGGSYCFRVTNAGSDTLYAYTTYPEATIATALTLTVTTDQFGTLTPGTTKFATSTLAVAASNPTGWNVTLSSDDRSTTNTVMDLDSDAATGITDQSEWIPGIATTSAGTAVRIASLVNSGEVLAFRLMTASGTAAFQSSTWWGSTDAYTDAASTLWAGIASSTVQRQIGNSSVSNAGALNTLLYHLKVPITQAQGSYSGPLTLTATANP